MNGGEARGLRVVRVVVGLSEGSIFREEPTNSSMGHDGIVEGGKILNDETIEQLCKQAICESFEF